MPARPIVVAVYGTLRRGERNDPFLAGAHHLGHGRIRGRIHEIPRSAFRAYAYPALVLDAPAPAAADAVVVELYVLPDDSALAALDVLEAYDPADDTRSEYVRREVPVADGPVDAAWVYVYNGPRSELGARIAGGDWVAHVRPAGDEAP